MKKFFTALTVCLIATTSIAQTGPGGYGTTDGASNLILWLRGDAGVLNGSSNPATNGQAVGTWQDQSGYGYNAQQTSSGNQPVLDLTNTINGNPVVVFDGSNDYFPISSLNYPAVTVPSGLTVYAVLTTTDSNEGIIISYDRNEYFRFATDHDGDGGFGLSTTNSGSAINDFNASSNGIEADGVPHILGGSFDPSVSGINKFLYFDGTIDNETNAGTLGMGTGTTRYGFIGVGSEANSFNGSRGPTNYLDGKLAEVIYYGEALSGTERQRVETYLAIKYGITLSSDTDGDGVAFEAGEGDYLAADGTTVVWDADVNSTYHHDVAGIAEDSNGGLAQASSRSMGATSIFTVTDHSLNEDDYILWGHNNAGLSATISLGSSYDLQFNRVWKIELTGSTTNIDALELDLSVASFLPSGSAFGLLIDDNAGFSSPVEVTGTAIGDTYTFSNVDLSAFSGDIYITGAFSTPLPGGVRSNLALWFKGDAGVEEASGDEAENGDAVRFWRDQSGSGYAGAQSNLSERPTYELTNTINFNPALSFDGSTHLPIQTLNYDLTTNTLDEFTVYSVVKSSQPTEGIILSYDRSSFFRLAINHMGNANPGLSTTVGTNIDDFNSAIAADDGQAHLVGGDFSATANNKNLFIDGSVETRNSAHSPAGALLGNSGEVPRFGFIAANSEAGSFDGSNSATGIDGSIAEIIYFESRLTASERAQVESYLAVKYGVTLATNFVASDGTTVIWDRTTNAGYNNMIAAVGLDNTATLSQTQSRSEDPNAILTISEAGLADGEYFFWGNDGADLSEVTSGTGSLDARLNRVWKIQATGATLTLDQLDFDLNNVVIKPEAAGNYRLLLDDNASFSSPTEVAATSFSNGILTFTNVDFTGESFTALALDPDLDNDGIADAEDIDDDNDGLLDTDEGSGLVDTDNDGIFDSRDLDSDNDGIGDLYESGAEADADVSTIAVSLDTDNDGMIDAGVSVGTNGYADILETAVDNDTRSFAISDSDTSGPADFRDLDTDNNGISDLVESGRSTAVDSDDDGVFEGVDLDEDGVPDEIDSHVGTFGSILDALDRNADGTPDFRDLDNDGDGTEDVDEVSLTDTTPDDGRLDGTTDAENDGVLSGRDDDDGVFGQISLASLLSGSGTDWYSFRSGDWDEPDNWTLDPSGTVRINPTGTFPNDFIDNVTVLNGDEMTVNFDGLVLSSLTIEEGGIVDIAMTINHNFNTISGAGAIKLASDEFPGGVNTDFISSAGGTVIYTDQSPAADYELTTARTFNHVIFSSAANSIVLQADYTLNGDLTVSTGTLQINDHTSDSFTDNTTPLNLTVNGNVTVDASGSITVGEVDAATQVTTNGVFAFHQFEILGDFTNNGDVRFTNLNSTSIADGRYRDRYPTATDPDNLVGSTISSAEYGVVEVLFTNGTADQLITLNGPTDFYRIEVAKGTSQTFIAEINASSESNFRLLGRIAMNQSDDSGDTPNIDNHRALGLEAGILKLGDNIVIDQIAKEDTNGATPSTQGGNRNYMIDLDAQLWLASNARVTKENEWGIHPFGRLKVSDNAQLTFTGSGQRTILVDNQGVFEMTGGTVDITQYRNKTGADGAPRGSFIMTGGTLNIGQGGADGNHALFSVPWEDQNFILSASDLANPPVINITMDANRGKDNAAIQIGVKEGNYNVGESDINVIHTTNRDYKISSTVPLYNLTYNNTGNNKLIISDIEDANDYAPSNPSATLPDDNSGTLPSPAAFAQPLMILNNLTITDGIFDANDQDITIGNLFTVSNGGAYDPGTNTTLFNGTSFLQQIRLNGTAPLTGGGFYNLSFSASGTTKELGGDLAMVVVLGDLTVDAGVTLDDNGKVVQVNGDINHSGFHETDASNPGRIEISGGAASHEIGGDGNGRFKVLTIDDATNAVSFTSDIQIDSVLNLGTGILDIGVHALTINSTATDPIRDDAGGIGNFGVTRMIQTAGNASDGGIRMFFGPTSDPGQALYPFGVAGKYTPAQIDLVNVSDDGHVQINPVNEDLSTTEASGGAQLDYYWRVRNDGFASLPDVTSLEFTADATDLAVPINLSEGKTATQSSTYNGRVAATAVDGNTSGNGEANVTHTQNDTEAYWTVDLGQIEDITTINIWNRTDCCGNRLQNYHVFVSDDAFTGTTVAESQAQSGVVEFFESAQAGSPTTINTGAITGRYVRVQLAGTNFLSLAEVEVLGGILSSATLVPGGVEDGVDSNDTPADDTAFDRFYELNGVASSTFTFDGEFSDGTVQPFQLRTANYTLGEAGRFTGAPDIFYTFRPGDGFPIKWNNGSNWTLGDNTAYDPHDSRQSAAGDYPQSGDVAVIGWVPHGDTGGTDGEPHGISIDGISVDVAEVRFSQMLDNMGNPTQRIYAYNFQFRPTVVVNGSGQITSGVISGEGMFWNRNSDPDYSNVDLGGFASQDSSYMLYENNSSARVYVNIPPVVPNMLIGASGWGANDLDFQLTTDLTVNQNLEILGDANLILSSGATGDISVANDLRIFRSNANGNNSGGFGRIDYPNDASRTIEIFGDLELDNEEAMIQVAAPDNTTQNIGQLIVHGNIYQDVINNGGLQLFTATDEDYVSLTLTGDGNHSFVANSGADASLYELIINKGSDPTSSFTFNQSFSLNGPTNTSQKALQIENGTLVLNNAGIDIELNSGGGDFTIPATAGLTLQEGTARVTATGTGSGNGIRLDGKITIGGGDLVLDGGTGADNYIEYGTGGGSAIEITAGNLVVGSQLRRNLLSDDGVLNYTQSGGTAVFGVNSAPDDGRGVFEIINTGVAGTSSFNLSGASTTFAIVRGQASPQQGTFIIGSDVAVSVTTDPVIDFGYNGTVAGVTVQNGLNEVYQINSAVALPNIRIDQAGYNTPTLELTIQPLTISNNLEILNAGSLKANNFDLTINNGFTNNGTYTPGTNTTIFNGAVQQILGSATTIFHNLRVNPSTSLTLNKPITVSNDLSIVSGFLDDNGNQISLLGDLNITTSHVGPGTGGIAMTGSGAQEINLPDGAAEVDHLIIDNSEGVTLKEVDALAVVLTIDDELALNNGIFLIEDNRVILDADAAVTTTNTFGPARMISVNGVKKSDGVEKAFSAGVDAPAFEIPIGTPDKYTPVTLDVDGADDAGSILVKPVNAAHPSATGADVLNYYWLVQSTPTTITNFAGSISFQYEEEDANNAGQNESTWENNASRLIAPNWFKPSTNLVNITTNTMTFTNSDLSSFGGTSFNGEYTIGNDIPDELAQYRSNGSGIWSLGANWDLENDGDGLFDDGNGVPQPGTIVIVDTGDEIVMSSATDNDQNIFSLQITGILDVNDSDGHNFGDVSGTGTLRISNASIPGGNYDNFFTTEAGSLELAGSGDYTISPDFASGIRGLAVSGGGVKTLPLIALSIGSDGISINDGTVLNNASNNNSITTSGDVNIHNGTFLLGNGSAALTAQNLSITAGSFTSAGSNTDLSGGLTMNGGTFSAGNGNINIEGDLALAGAATFNNGSGTITLDGAADQNLSGSFSSDGFSNLVINKSAGDVVLASNATIHIENTLTLTSGNINTQASNAALRLLNGVGSVVRTSGFIDGPLQVDLNDGDAFSFPVGKSSTYKPVAITIQNGSQSSNPLTWEGEYYQAAATTYSSAENSGMNLNNIEVNADVDEQVENVNSTEFWRLDSGGGSASLDEVTLDISNLGLTVDNIGDQKVQVLTWDNAGSEWDHLGGISSGSPSAANVASTNVLTFSERIVTSGTEGDLVLPVALIEFSGVAEDNQVLLNWSTASELNNDYFEVQRSRDGVAFEAIGVVQGNGTTTDISSYDFVDRLPGQGTNYYRLKQVDHNGNHEIHPTIWVQNEFYQAGISATVYPNPAHASNLNIQVSSGDDFHPINISVRGLSGKLYYKETHEASLSIDTKIDFQTRVEPGLYFLIVEQGGSISKRKVLIR